MWVTIFSIAVVAVLGILVWRLCRTDDKKPVKKISPDVKQK